MNNGYYSYRIKPSETDGQKLLNFFLGELTTQLRIIGILQ